MDTTLTPIILKAGISIILRSSKNFFFNENVDSQIKSAYKNALKEWCPNKSIRKREELRLKTKLERYISEDSANDPTLKDNDLKSFIPSFKKAIAKKPIAFNFLKDIKDEQANTILVESVQSIDSKLESIEEKVQSLNHQQNQLTIDERITEVLKIIRDLIFDLKVKSALKGLLRIEKELNQGPVETSKKILGQIQFLKADCLSFLNQADDSYQGFIKAYKLEPSKILYQEKACLAYYHFKEYDKVKNTVELILNADDYNPTAWAVKLLLSEEKSISKLINETPSIVSSDITFKRILFSLSYSNNDFIKNIEDYNLPRPSIKIYNSLDSNNFKEVIVIIAGQIQKHLNSLVISFTEISEPNIELVNKLKPLLQITLEAIRSSEVEGFGNYSFLNAHFDFVITKKKGHVFEMKRVFDKHKLSGSLYLSLLANDLQLIGEDNEAKGLVDDKVESDIICCLIKQFIHVKRREYKKAINAHKAYLKLVDVINSEEAEQILMLFFQLLIQAKSIEIVSEINLEEKRFVKDELKAFLLAFQNIVLDDNSNIIQGDSPIWIELKKYPTLNFYIAIYFFLTEQFEHAMAHFESYLDIDKESNDLFFYIKSLYAANSNNVELLKLLKSWRLNFTFDIELLRIEIQLHQLLQDWPECIEVCKYYLEKKPNDQSVFAAYLFSLSRENRIEEIELQVEKIIELEWNKFSNARIAVSVLLTTKRFSEALELLFKYAKDINNVEARSMYIGFSTQIPDGLINEFKKITKGTFVKYEVNGQVKLQEIGEDKISQKLLNHKVGDSIKIERQITKQQDELVVLRIMDKYLCLFEEVLLDITNNPYDGIPAASFHIEEGKPEKLIEFLKSTFGNQGDEDRIKKETLINDYYLAKISFSELARAMYRSNFFGAYFDLVQRQRGFLLVPLILQPKFKLDIKTEFILDYSSLPLIYQMHKEHDLKLDSELIVSKSITEDIKDLINKEKSEPNDQLYVNITSDSVSNTVKSKNEKEKNITYLEGLLKWIEDNCTVNNPISRIKIARDLDQKISKDVLINNYSLLHDQANRILVSDDTMYFKLFPIGSGKLMSSEMFIKSLVGENAKCNEEFIVNRYLGYTVSSSQLKTQYDRLRKGLENHYPICLSNLSLLRNMNLKNVETAIEFVKELALDSTLTERNLQLEVSNVFRDLLIGLNNEEAFKSIYSRLIKDFKLLGATQDTIISGYKSAIEIIKRI